MNPEYQDNQLPQNAPADVPDTTPEAMPSTAEPQSEQVQFFKKLHALLRGRYKWAISLGLLGLIVGGAVGYLIPVPTYRSTATVRIRSSVPTIQTRSPLTRIDNYKQFMRTQVGLIQSDRVLDMAYEQVIQSQAWRQLGRDPSPRAKARLRGGLGAEYVEGTEFIHIYFEDRFREAAAAATTAVTEAYVQLFEEYFQGSTDKAYTTLNNKETRLERSLSRIESQINNAVGQYGIKGLPMVHQATLAQLQRYKERLKSVRLALEQQRTARKKQQANKSQPGRPRQTRNPSATGPQGQRASADGGSGAARLQLTPRQIAQQDPRMQAMLRERVTLERQIAKAKQRFGSEHRVMRKLQTALKLLNEHIHEYAAHYRPSPTGEGQAGYLGAMTLKQLRNREKTLQQWVTETREKLNDLNERLDTLARLQRRKQGVLADLERTRNSLQAMRTESPMTNDRLDVISKAGDTLTLYDDKRPEMAALGAMAGFGVGVGLILLLGFRDQRLRHSEQAHASIGHLHMLGILPSMPEDLSDPQQASVAAYCVHQIRTLLQISIGRVEHASSEVSGGGGGHAHHRLVPVPAIAVTSPTSGDGKTSLTLALGASFAAAGNRTLVIDFDLRGGGLTSRVDAIRRRKIGRILRRKNLISETQFDKALTYALSTQKRVGEALIELGYLSETDLNEALSVQEQTSLGVLDVLEGEPFASCVADTGIANLSMLSVGSASAKDVCMLSPNGVNRIVDEARALFDVVLIDTGPIPHSLEASLLATEVDSLVLTVSHDTPRPQVEKAVAHLESVGAPVAGVVFNRAERGDMEQHSSSVYLSREQDSGKRTGLVHQVEIQELREDRHSSRFGPVARAVASSAPDSVTENGNGSTKTES